MGDGSAVSKNGSGSDARAGSALFRAIVPLVLIALFTWIGYANSLDVPFTFDDERNIERNASVHMSEFTLDAIRVAATENPTPRPVAYVSFALNYFMGGLDVRGYHVVNILIHMVNGFLVYLLMVQIGPSIFTQREKIQESGVRLFALAIALIFITHPVQTQSVTYIVQRMASMCAMFYMASLLMYIWGRGGDLATRTRVMCFLLSVFFWICAIGSKQYAVVLPAAVLLYEWLIVGKGQLRFSRGVALAGAGSGALMIVVVLVFKYDSLGKLLIAGYDRRDFTMLERVLTESRVVMHYLSLLVWPTPARLTLVYDFPVSRSFFEPLSTIASLIIIVVCAGLALRSARTRPFLAFGILWFGLHLLVESTIIPLELVYEHRLYLPLIGASILVIGALFSVIKNPRVAFSIVLALSTLLTVSTVLRNQEWRDELGFWLDNIEKQPTEPRAHFNAGILYKDQGLFLESIDSLGKAIEYEPRYQEAMVLRGGLMVQEKDYQGALAEFDRAIEMNATDLGKWGRFSAEAYAQRGILYQSLNQPFRAYNDYTESLKLRDDDVATLSKRGVALLSMKRYRESVEDLERVLELAPGYFVAKSNLAWIYATCPDDELRDGPLAVELAYAACEITQWSEFSILSTYAASLAEAGRFEEAVRWQIRCNELAPDALGPRYEARLELYQQGFAYRDQ